MSIEELFDQPFIASLALREKQIQQNYRPIIAVHKWFARRPGTLFRGLTLAEFGNGPLRKSFFEANNFHGKVVVDPFMGGGTPLLEANRVGCDVLGFDINPMAAWIVREEMEHLDIAAYRKEADALITQLTGVVGKLYRTDCPIYGDRDVPAKYFLWVKVLKCFNCSRDFDLFPGYLLADDNRHPKNVVVCANCGQLNEIVDLNCLGTCGSCSSNLQLSGPARRNRCACPHCGEVHKYSWPEAGPPRHRMFAIEYFNPARKQRHLGRFFKTPDANDLGLAECAAKEWRSLQSEFVPTEEIQRGDESSRLHRWGYKRYRDLFNERQLFGLEHSCRLIAAVKDERIRHALATNLSDLLRYQNLLCRYDTSALKSLDIFSVHGFPVGLVQCESNLLGITNEKGFSVGSGGWTNVIEKYSKAKRYCDAPFEVRHAGRKKVVVPVPGEWIGAHCKGQRSRRIEIRCVSSATVELPPESVDAIFTDPPYFGNVQYGELMDFCYVWLRRLIGSDAEGFSRTSTRSPDELTGNETESRDLAHFTEGLSLVFQRMAKALKKGAPFVFTFHHNRLEAYHSIGIAILDAGLECTAAIACPAEMGGSIHIHGTGSSIVDTVFICRTAKSAICQVPSHAGNPLQEVKREAKVLQSAGMTPSLGDLRCILFGHLTRIAISRLRADWDRSRPVTDKLQSFATIVKQYEDPVAIMRQLSDVSSRLEGAAFNQLALFGKDTPDGLSL